VVGVSPRASLYDDDFIYREVRPNSPETARCFKKSRLLYLKTGFPTWPKGREISNRQARSSWSRDTPREWRAILAGW